MDTGINQAIKELKQAEQNFEYAAPEFVDIAILELLAAKMKVNMFFSLKKQNPYSPTDL
ncbi:hypothetical protein G9F72_010945 [Clostridium estertheticum]|uniref:hypothetical protein n=1 Tax=Clostridium estertheticum TaxID=238834 RepID=UPI0013E965D8|nr:hypothetical protein [Clostridium estertheticum]MBZ9686841.1 hypothetical protein [Clostridium estertheticum]